MLDLVLEAHFHGLLRIPRTSLVAGGDKSKGRGATEGKYDKDEEEKEGLRAKTDAASGLPASTSTSSSNTTSSSSSAGEDVVWVRGYRPIVVEDDKRIERLAEMFGVSPMDVRKALETMLEDKKKEFSSFKLYLGEE